MKKIITMTLIFSSLFYLVSCKNTNKANPDKKTDTSHNSSLSTSSSTVTQSSSTSSANSSQPLTDKNTNTKPLTDPLATFTDDQIEYARIWLSIGTNQDIETLYIKQIPAGTLINPNDETSTKYPLAVTQLSGSRLVDGSITYSSNGNGTINVYPIPFRWENEPTETNMKATTQAMLEQIKVIKVETENPEAVKQLIEKQTFTD